ncbi:hypothetical protein J7I91_18815, partial [Pseudomonas sp. ISL-84]|nr:hypothetical protein [Pseudomonas sp. ISL-84]
LENAFAFSSYDVYSRMLFQCPAGGEGVRDPTGEAEEALIPPRGFAACPQRKSTGIIYKLYKNQ